MEFVACGGLGDGARVGPGPLSPEPLQSHLGKGREGAVQVALGREPILLLAMRAQRLQVTTLSSAVCAE